MNIKKRLEGIAGRCVMNGVEYTFVADFEFQWSSRYGITNVDVDYVVDMVRVSDNYELWDDEAEAWEKEFVEQVRVGKITPFDDVILAHVEEVA